MAEFIELKDVCPIILGVIDPEEHVSVTPFSRSLALAVIFCTNTAAWSRLLFASLRADVANFSGNPMSVRAVIFWGSGSKK
jgi:hypothetical protein